MKRLAPAAAILLMAAFPAAAGAQTTGFDPSATVRTDGSLGPGSTFSVNVTVAGLTSAVNAVSLAVDYDPAILVFRSSTMGTFFSGGSALVVRNWETVPGHYYLAAAVTGSGFTGSGTVVRLTFDVVGWGSTKLDLKAGDDMASQGYTEPVMVTTPGASAFGVPGTDGSFSNSSPDLAVTAISAPASATLGSPVPLLVTVTNLGNQATGPFTVHFAEGLNAIAAIPVADLAPGASVDVPATWSTIGRPAGAHTITASADPLPGDPVGNNSLSTIVTLTAAAATAPPASDEGSGGGCGNSADGARGGLLILLAALTFLAVPVRRAARG